VLVADSQCVPDQQCTHARAVDEQVAFDLAAVRQLHGFDETALGIMDDFDDPSFDARHSARLAFTAEKPAEQRRIEVIGIVDIRERGLRIARVGECEFVLQ
jgi:hypothetical protein